MLLDKGFPYLRHTAYQTEFLETITGDLIWQVSTFGKDSKYPCSSLLNLPVNPKTGKKYSADKVSDSERLLGKSICLDDCWAIVRSNNGAKRWYLLRFFYCLSVKRFHLFFLKFNFFFFFVMTGRWLLCYLSFIYCNWRAMNAIYEDSGWLCCN